MDRGRNGPWPRQGVERSIDMGRHICDSGFWDVGKTPRGLTPIVLSGELGPCHNKVRQPRTASPRKSNATSAEARPGADSPRPRLPAPSARRPLNLDGLSPSSSSGVPYSATRLFSQARNSRPRAAIFHFGVLSGL